MNRAHGLSRGQAWTPLFLALLFTLPALSVGFSHDDLLQRLILEGKLPAFSPSWFSLYDFTRPHLPTPTLIEHGYLPWFTNPELSLRFLRPVSSFTLALDHLCFGRQALPAHLHSLLWMLLLTFVASRLYARWFVILGIAATLGCGALLRALRSELPSSSRRTLRWLALATFVSLWALVGAVVTGRVLPLAMLGAAALIGNLLSAAWGRFRASSSEAANRKRWLAPILLLSLLHFGASPLVRVSSALQFRGFARAQRELAQRAELGRCSNQGFVYLLTSADPILALSTASAIAFYAPEKAGAERFRTLSMAPQEQRLQRVAPNAFELSMRELPRRRNAFESLYRAPDNPLRAGQRYRTEELSSLVLAADSGVFTKARFELESAADVGKVCLLV